MVLLIIIFFVGLYGNLLKIIASEKKQRKKEILDYWNKNHVYADFDEQLAEEEFYAAYPEKRKKSRKEVRAEHKEKKRIEEEKIKAEEEKTLLEHQKEWNSHFPDKEFSEGEYFQWKAQEREKARQAQQEAEWNKAFPGEQYSSARYNRWQEDIKNKAEQEQIQEQKHQEKVEQEKKREAELKNRVKCPTCGSQNTRRLSDVEKAFDMSGIGTLAGGGLKSPSLGKTFKCDSCGYYW